MTVHVIRSAGLLLVNNDSVNEEHLFLKFAPSDRIIEMPARSINMKYAHFDEGD